MTRGLFITFEGGEGSGKTTQSRRLAQWLAEQGRVCITTREPGGTPEAEKIRDLLVQHDGGAWTPLAECGLFFSARHMHIETKIKPALHEGNIVVCDRFTDSTIAYQGYGKGADLESISRLNSIMTNNFQPNLTLLFDLPIEIGLDRSLKRNSEASGKENTEDRFELLDRSFHNRMRDGYLAIARNNPKRVIVIDANRSPEIIFSEISRYVSERLDAL